MPYPSDDTYPGDLFPGGLPSAPGQYSFQFGGVAFGYGCRLATDDGGFDPGSHTSRVQDASNPVGDGFFMGRDYLDPATWTWELTTMAETEDDALDAIDELATVWLDEDTRNVPSIVYPLRYAVGGRVRRVYGRPRRWQAAIDNRMLSGAIPVTCDFQRADMLHYSDEEYSQIMSIIPSTSSGLVSAPGIVAPLMATGDAGDRAGTLPVGGRTKTWPVFEISAPNGLVAPYVLGNDEWGVAFTRNGGLTMPHGSTLTFDTRPWARTMLLNGGSVAGFLKQGIDLDKVRLNPGSNVLQFGGTDETGTATLTVKWREASRSI